MPKHSYKVLVLSRNYPNNIIKLLGIWVERLCRYCSQLCEIKVIAPIPYFPPLPAFTEYGRFRQVEPYSHSDGIEVFHPRFLVGPGQTLYNTEAMMYNLGVRRQVKQIHQEFPFDLIHAHFSYPDGVIAARLGQRYRVPVIITEHAPWQPWMEEYPQVRRQAVWASEQCAFHIPVSHYVRNTIIQYTGESEKLRIIPVGVDCSVFAPPPDSHEPDLNQILYVGQINFTKGIDVLLQAMCQLIAQRPRVRLVLVGGSFYRLKRLQEERLRSLARELGLENHVEFVGEKSHQDIAELMRRSALLVLPSRAESFGAVLVEAIACGTPVVATQCGGPEDIVNDKVGVLVPKEDVDALASGMLHVLTHREHYSSAHLRSYAIENFSWERIAHQTVNLYRAALERDRQRRGLKDSEVGQTLKV